MKTWLKYFVYSFIVFGLIFAGRTIIVQYTFLFEACMAYSFFVLSMSISALLFIMIGILLGVERLFTERKKEGKWKLNLPKVVLIGIPSLYLALILPLSYTSLSVIYSPIWKFLLNGGKHGLDFIPVVQVILGYTVISSFYKQKENKIPVKEDLGGNEVLWDNVQ